MVALPGQLFYCDPDSRLPVVPRPRPERQAVSATGAAKSCSWTPASSASWSTVLTGSFPPTTFARIADTYHTWRGQEGAGEYADVPGFCRSAPLDEVRKHGHVLTPGRYVGAEAPEDDGEPFEDKMKRLVAEASRAAGGRRAAGRSDRCQS